MRMFTKSQQDAVINAIIGPFKTMMEQADTLKRPEIIRVDDYQMDGVKWIEMYLRRDTDPEDFIVARRFHINDISDFLKDQEELQREVKSFNGDGYWDTDIEEIGIEEWIMSTDYIHKLAIFELFIGTRPHLHDVLDKELTHRGQS